MALKKHYLHLFSAIIPHMNISQNNFQFCLNTSYNIKKQANIIGYGGCTLMWSVYGVEVCESESGAMLSQCFGSG